MPRLTICWLTLGLGLACAQPAAAAEKDLQGIWIATKAERDGKAASDVVRHRLAFAGDGFQIQSMDAKSLYAGTVRVDPSTKPQAQLPCISRAILQPASVRSAGRLELQWRVCCLRTSGTRVPI